MKYRIPVLSSVVMSTTGCLSADPIEGEWTLSESDPLCMEYQKSYTYGDKETSISNEICLEFGEMSLSVTSPEEDVLAAELSGGDGTVQFGYTYVYDGETETESYQSDFTIGNGVDFETISEDLYKMTLEINLDTDDENTAVDAVLDCTLTDQKTLTCEQSDLIVDGESYTMMFVFSGALTFTK